MADWAVIFDVDGVLLELTRAEEEVFFDALSRFVPTENLSRDWNSYKIRNDDDIIAEILGRNGLQPQIKPAVISHYLDLLSKAIQQGLPSISIAGAAELLESIEIRYNAQGTSPALRAPSPEGRDSLLLPPDTSKRGAFTASPFPLGRVPEGRERSLRARHTTLAIATANLLAAAQLRLQAAGLWDPVAALAQGADGGGHKSEILSRLLARLNLPPSRIIFIGDNLNDLIAARENGTGFIAFSTDPTRRAMFRAQGASYISGNHQETKTLLEQLMA